MIQWNGRTVAPLYFAETSFIEHLATGGHVEAAILRGIGFSITRIRSCLGVNYICAGRQPATVESLTYFPFSL